LRRSCLFALGWVCSGCAGGPPALDLAAAGDRIVSASVAGRDRAWLLGQLDKGVRLPDGHWRAIPAGAPSRTVFELELPRDARLELACGVDEALEGLGSVEFIVKLASEAGESVVHHALLDPTHKPEHRGFVPASVDLRAHAGRRVRLSFETSSQAALRDPKSAAWGNPVLTSRDEGQPLVVVYLVDTLRADHTSVYGYARPTTPRLAELARDGVVFENAVAQSSWTRPAVASLLTSLLPAEHGAVFVRGRVMPPTETLAEMLDARGFATAAAVSNTVVSAPRTGFEQGFHVFLDRRPQAQDTVDAALERLGAMAGRPAFLYVHTMDPHIPYAPPEPWLSMFEPKPTPQAPGRDPRRDPDPVANRDAFVARYDGEIAYGDAQLGRFLDELKARGLYDRALIVFLSDHGEEFYDHGDWGHGVSLYEELVRIPLVVKYPRQRGAGRRVSRLVQHVDVVPTVLRELGLPIPERLAGRPLQEAGTAAERPALLEVSHRGHVLHGVRRGREKYLRRFSPADDEVYFDLAQDPGEERNAVGTLGERLRALRAEIGPSLRPNPFHNVVRCVGPGAYELEIGVAGWIEDVDGTGLGKNGSVTLAPERERLGVLCRPGPGESRELRFIARPRGTRVTLSGRREGRPLRPEEVRLGGEAVAARELPSVLPDLDSAPEFKPFAPQQARSGVYSWIEKRPGDDVLELDASAQEQLRALGYIQ
jgi:arylsulfatase A-like enzyme